MAIIIKKISKKAAFSLFAVFGFFVILVAKMLGGATYLSNAGDKAKGLLAGCCSLNGVANADVPGPGPGSDGCDPPGGGMY